MRKDKKVCHESCRHLFVRKSSGLYLSCHPSFVQPRGVLFNGNTWQQPVTSYDAENKSTEQHLAAFLSPLSFSWRAYIASRSLSLSLSCILRGSRTKPKPARRKHTHIHTYIHTRYMNSSRWSSKRKIIKRINAKGKRDGRREGGEEGCWSRSYLTGWPQERPGPLLCQFLVIPRASFATKELRSAAQYLITQTTGINFNMVRGEAGKNG